MGLLIAPYNNAMRLGQGFNTYTQQICIDDAVIVDPGRQFNVLTNDGTTMADLRLAMKGPSAYSELTEASPNELERITAHEGGDDAHDPDPELDPATKDETDDDEPQPVKKQLEAKPKPAAEEDDDDEDEDEEEDDDDDDEDEEESDADESEGNKEESKTPDGDDDADSDEEDEKPAPVKAKPIPASKSLVPKKPTVEERKKARIDAAEKKKRAQDDLKQEKARQLAEDQAEERRQKADKRAREAADGVKAYIKAERDSWLGKIHADIEKSAGASPMDGLKAKRTRSYITKSTGSRGPSQIVTYTSCFVDKLSDVTDDMSISGALSIKYGAIGGSGRGSFVNSDKFKESDLNFYISVKVVNQTVNMKDALVYQPLRSVDSNNFLEVYGDSFISGFVEGGEFNAIVSMKVHNKAQVTNIQAEAKVALTVGMAEVKAEAAVSVAKKNINNNTETTIMVSWSGGGYIKPMDEPWDIESLMSAAARFPDLVAVTPQRTYAVLTKYETLRSFVKLKPASFSRMAYENAQIYTNTLMDIYMEYKTVYKKLSSWMLDVENNISTIQENPVWKKIPKTKGHSSSSKTLAKVDPLSASAQDESHFDTTLGGLDKARKACRFQMVRIVNEVDAITKDPSLATLETREEPFQPTRVFKERLPLVKSILPPPAVPLRLEELAPGLSRAYPQICVDMGNIEPDERLALTEMELDRPALSRFFRLALPVGSAKNGTAFNNLDFLKYNAVITGVRVDLYKGVVTYIETSYSNGMVCRHGGIYDSGDSQSFVLKDLGDHERLIAATVETGEEMAKGEQDVKPIPKKGESMDTTPAVEARITRLKLYTNRGRCLAAQLDKNKNLDDKKIFAIDDRGLRRYRNLKVTHFDPVMDNAFIKGFWGYSNNGLYGMAEDGIWRLGVIWGNNLKPEIPPAPPGADDKDQANDGTDASTSKK